MVTVSFRTLGCKLNQCETAQMEEALLARGYQLVSWNAPADGPRAEHLHGDGQDGQGVSSGDPPGAASGSRLPHGGDRLLRAGGAGADGRHPRRRPWCWATSTSCAWAITWSDSSPGRRAQEAAMGRSPLRPA